MFPVTPATAAKGCVILSTVSQRVKRHRIKHQLIRVEVSVRTPAEATAIRHFARMLKSPQTGPASIAIPEYHASRPAQIAGQWALTDESRAVLDEFGAALDGAPRAIIDRARRMALTLTEASARLDAANTLLTNPEGAPHD